MKINFKNFWDKNLDKQLQKQLLSFFKEEIQNKDNEIFKSKWRKNKGYIPHAILARTIITKYGRIQYKRRLYKYWNNDINKWKYVFLVDKEFDIIKWQRIHQSLKFEILKKVSNGLVQQVINDQFLFADISTKSISNVINSFNFNLLANPSLYNIKKVNLDKCLYINVDETFCSLRINKQIKKFRIRIAIFYTGLIKMKNRNVLLNKKIYFILVNEKKPINTYNFSNDILKFAKNFYFNVDKVTKIISGDSAKWIRKLNEYLPDSIYIADKFHLIKDLRILKANNKKILNFLEQGNYQDFLNLLKAKYQTLNQPTYLQKIAFSTLKNNKIGIINQAHQLNIGTFAESNISIIKSLFGFNNKALGYLTFKNMLNLKIAKINDLNILDLLKKEFIINNFQIKQFYKMAHWKNYQNLCCQIDFSLFKFKDKTIQMRNTNIINK